MGLDQWINISNNKTDMHESVWEGRNEHAIHGWMRELFLRKGGNYNVAFNCESILVLNESDMLNLINDLALDNESCQHFEGLDSVLRTEYVSVANKALVLLMNNESLYYTSWW